MKAKVEGILTELMVKTKVDYVFMTDGGQEVTLASKLAEIITSLNTKASQTNVETLVNNLRQEMLGDTPVEAYNTFTELAQYISEHKEVSDALTEAIGKKADATTVQQIQETLNGLGALATKSKVAETDLDNDLKSKINAVDGAKHSHANKTLLDTYTQTEANLADAVAKKHNHDNKAELDKIATGDKAKWDSAADKAHEHANKAELDKIQSGDKAKWDKAQENVIEKFSVNGVDVAPDGNKKVAIVTPRIYVQETEPAGLTDSDLFFQIVQ